MAGFSFGSQSSSSKPMLFGPSQLMLPQQKAMWGAMGPNLLEKALMGGYSPSERSRMLTRTSSNINAGMKSGIGNLRDIYAKSGLRGGVMGGDISDIMEAGVAAKGKAAMDIEDMSREEGMNRWKNLLAMMTWTPPALVGNVSRGKGFNFGISGGGS